MKPSIGISEKHIEKSIQILSKIISNETVLYVKTRKAHWNISGESFMELHELFGNQYATTEKSIDILAERISKIGGKTIGTMNEFLENSDIQENPGKYPDKSELLMELINDHETIIKQIRKEIHEFDEKAKDVVSIDLLIKLLDEHETTAWTMRRYFK